MNQRDRDTWRTFTRLSIDARRALDGSDSISRLTPWPVYEELLTWRCITRRSGRVTARGHRVAAAVAGEMGSPPSWEELTS